MPSVPGKDKDGCYWKWGRRGHKYHYKCGDREASKRAKALANAQGVAIHASGYRGSK